MLFFDFSDYLKDHLFHDESNKNVIGKFKDELNEKIMEKGFFKTAFNVGGEKKKNLKELRKILLKLKNWTTLKDVG